MNRPADDGSDYDLTGTPAPDALRSPREETLVQAIRAASAGAGSALEVYRVALARVTPLVEADFASVFLRDDEAPDLLRLACAQNWPQSSARFLSEVRIREGKGPTGLALKEGRSVEVVDVFEDPELEEWWEPARELGFVAMTAQPLVAEGDVRGVVSFYFSSRDPLTDHGRALIAAAAREMAAAALSVKG